MTIMEIIITIRANHWFFRVKITPQSPARLPGRPLNALIITIKGIQCVCFWIRVCVCVRAYVWLTLWPPTTLSSHLPQRSPESVCVHRDKGAAMRAPQGAAAASFHSVTGFSLQPEDIVCQCGAQLAYLLRPALNEPTVNGLETPRCCIWDRQSWCVCGGEREIVLLCVIIKVCVNSMVPMSWGILPTRRWDGKVF